MTLYEIDLKLLEALENVDSETGELLDFEAFAELQMEREKKIENTLCYIKNLEAEAKMIAAEENALHERRKAKENKAERLRKYVADILGGECFETARCGVSYRNSTSLNVSDSLAAISYLNLIHPDMVIRPEPTISKRDVTALIKNGETIPGCEIVTKRNMSVK